MRERGHLLTAQTAGPTPGPRGEPDLVRQYDASRNTVRLALALLTNQGLVVTRQGLGTFVQAPAKPFTALLSPRVKLPPGGAAEIDQYLYGTPPRSE